MRSAHSVTIEGHVRPGFEAVRDAFAENFAQRHELGGACCVYHRGEPVVDLWGGVRNKETGEPWEQDTMVLVNSATKGFAAMTLAIAHSRGWLDYDQRVSSYWPEFGQQGKETITEPPFGTGDPVLAFGRAREGDPELIAGSPSGPVRHR